MNTVRYHAVVKPLSPIMREVVSGGAKFECSCGEVFRKIEHAKNCRKCFRYLGERCDEVHDLSPRLNGQPAKLVWSLGQ